MSQSRLGSLAESFANIAIGYGVAVSAQVLLFPLYGINGVSLQTNLSLGAVFTVISLVRSYVLRRAFNSISRKHHATEAISRRLRDIRSS